MNDTKSSELDGGGNISSSRPEDLPNLLNHTGDDEDPLAAMRGKPEYAELIQELEIIAAAAKKLFEPVEPSDAVWDKIATNLHPKSGV